MSQISRGPKVGIRCFMHLRASDKVFFATAWARDSIHFLAAASNVGGSSRFFTPALTFSFTRECLAFRVGGFVDHPAREAETIGIDAVVSSLVDHCFFPFS